MSGGSWTYIVRPLTWPPTEWRRPLMSRRWCWGWWRGTPPSASAWARSAWWRRPAWTRRRCCGRETWTGCWARSWSSGKSSRWSPDGAGRRLSSGAAWEMWPSSGTHLLRGGVGGLDGRLGEGDLDGGQVRRQRVGDALHDVAHLGAAAHRHRDALGNLRRNLGNLLQHHRRRAGRVGSPPLARLLVFVRTTHTWEGRWMITLSITFWIHLLIIWFSHQENSVILHQSPTSPKTKDTKSTIIIWLLITIRSISIWYKTHYDVETHSSHRPCSRWAAPPRWTRGWAVVGTSPLLPSPRWWM